MDLFVSGKLVCKSLFFICILFMMPFVLLAQQRPGQDSTRSPMAGSGQRNAAGIKPYSEVIPSRAKTDAGLFTVHQVDDNYFFEIPDSLLGRDILVVNRISKAAADVKVTFGAVLGFAGDIIGAITIRFEKGPQNKIFLKTMSFKEFSKDTSGQGMYQAVMNSNLQPLSASFEVKALGKDTASGTGSVIIDVTSFVNSDTDVLFFRSSRKKTLALGALQTDRSYIVGIRSFPQNIEVKTVKTYIRTVGGSGSSGAGNAVELATYELNSSIVLMPKDPMQPRFFDPRVGYFSVDYTDFDFNPQGVKKLSRIMRWRLEPKPQDVERYIRGELVEPIRQIVFYIDPATPKKWVPYLIQGVNDWNVAFEKAGWKNAIIAREAPTDDPEWSIDDARHSAIVYKASAFPNASGPRVYDPRSGEIMESHVNWYHNVMKLVHDWYFIQASAVDPRARTIQFDDKLMGELIRFVSSHEVGHTLGLMHNYGASSTVPVEKLRDKEWVEKHGHTPSIMDYARFNYVAQPEDSISEKGIFPRIGEYDKWAIEWGYRWFPEYKSPEEELPKLNQWIIEKTSNNKALWFGTELDEDDPRAQNEDLGDNSMKASAYGIKNLRRILSNLLHWTKQPNEDYSEAKRMHGEVVMQFHRYILHVAKNIGGIYTTPRMVEEKGDVVSYVPKATQKEAMFFLNQQVFTTPTWLLDKELFAKAGVGGPHIISGMQNAALDKLLNPSTMEKLLKFEALDPSGAYTVSQLLQDLKAGIWSELGKRTSINLYRRNLQKLYTDKIISLAWPSAAGKGPGGGQVSPASDAISLLKGHGKSLLAAIKAALPGVSDRLTRLHLIDIEERLENAIKGK